jgi:hypothetical protein
MKSETLLTIALIGAVAVGALVFLKRSSGGDVQSSPLTPQTSDEWAKWAGLSSLGASLANAFGSYEDAQVSKAAIDAAAGIASETSASGNGM